MTHLPTTYEALGSAPSPSYTRCAGVQYSLSIPEVEAGESQVQGHLQVCSEFKASPRIHGVLSQETNQPNNQTAKTSIQLKHPNKQTQNLECQGLGTNPLTHEPQITLKIHTVIVKRLY